MSPRSTCYSAWDRKSTRLNSSHVKSSYAVFCLKKKKEPQTNRRRDRRRTKAIRFPVYSRYPNRSDGSSRISSASNRPVRVVSSFFFLMIRRTTRSTLFPYTTLFRSRPQGFEARRRLPCGRIGAAAFDPSAARDRKSTRLNSSHVKISYAVFCLKK